ncbi:hypothetical protein GALMADRAFT_247206 [Galerina marginata CBS 339.88]|uniref:HD/PDEase domain-containing protein n=1 Tax=Galerina marginata (strain CBS 339.88) TaxID=685588 RepID=A0A067T127_GALM3|nr:hypothetical protein GALMADRAFT_247206 [Galerina marginata CBS 339.88]
MYPTIQEKAIVDATEKIMIETMARYDPSHDKHHVQRVRRTALTLARSIHPTPDLLTVELAALLHDVLDKKYVTAEEAADPFTFFLPLFKTMAAEHEVDLIQDGRAQVITRIIDNVSWTTEKKLRETGKWSDWHDQCTELHCVQDADRLDAIGAFGIMRCSAYSTVTNRPLHTPPDDPEHLHTSIQHFYDKLVKIRDRLKTGPGRKLGDKRHKVVSC